METCSFFILHLFGDVPLACADLCHKGLDANVVNGIWIGS